MKKSKKYALWVGLPLIAQLNFAFAAVQDDAETIFDWAEKAYSSFFSSKQNTNAAGQWLYRYYPTTDIYLGVNKDDSSVYVLGGAFGNKPVYIDKIPAVLKMKTNGEAPVGNNGTCDTSKAPKGISYTQNGNTTTITTNGQCVDLPSQGLCTPPAAASATNIHVLTYNQTSSSKMQGIDFSMSGMPNPLETLGDNISNSKNCTIHAPVDFGSQIVNYDVCYNLSSQPGISDLQSIPGVLTVTPPITMKTVGSLRNETVPDCFKTDAATITNLVTKEIWVKQNGAFVKL